MESKKVGLDRVNADMACFVCWQTNCRPWHEMHVLFVGVRGLLC